MDEGGSRRLVMAYNERSLCAAADFNIIMMKSTETIP